MKTTEELKEIISEVLCKIGDLIKVTREKKGLKLSDLYRISGISSSVISDLENHKGAMPSIYTLMAIANALELPQEAFVELMIGGLNAGKDTNKLNILTVALCEYGLPPADLPNVTDYINYCIYKEKNKANT